MKHSYFTKLTGTSFRQKEIEKLKPGKTPLRIVAQDDNEYDPYACEVQALIGEGWTQIGWVAKGSNEDIHKFIKSGGSVDISLKDVTGGDNNHPTCGVNVAITYGEDDSVNLNKLEKQVVQIGDEPFVFFDAVNHIAYDSEGHRLQSGSETEHKYAGEADLTYAAKAIAKKTGLKPADIQAVWDAKGELSRMYGTLLHRAIEQSIVFGEEMQALDEFKKRDPSASNWCPPIVSTAVDKLFDKLYIDLGYTSSVMKTEVRLKYKNLTGIADLLIIKDNDVNLIDFKTNNEIKKVKYPFGTENQYTVQQNQYREILEHNGYNVLSMELYHWTGKEWDIIPVKRINLEDEING